MKLKLLALLLLFPLNIFAAGKDQTSDKSLYITLRVTMLRKSPEAWAPAVTELRYQDAVTKLEETNGWLKVSTAKGKTGYIPVSAVTESKASASKNIVSSFLAPTDESEIALAGKGFGEETEAKFKKENSATNFAALEKIERNRVSEGELRRFAQDGRLL